MNKTKKTNIRFILPTPQSPPWRGKISLLLVLKQGEAETPAYRQTEV
jgi:hypothetical protein